MGSWPFRKKDDLTGSMCECKRCGWKWIPRTANMPRECPNCKSYKWNDLKNR